MAQADTNAKDRFGASPMLSKAITDAIIAALDAHSVMCKQALESPQVWQGLKDVLLGPAKLYEALRDKAA